MAGMLLIEPIGGIAGDMFLAAALDLGVDRGALVGALRTLGLEGWELESSRVEVGGIAGTHVAVKVAHGSHGEEEHRHDHHGRHLPEILAMIDGSRLSPRARQAARDVFERIGRAEARVHGVPVDEVHFHEVGAVDSIVDVCGAAVALDLLGWPRVVSLPPELGHGFVHTAHGRLPVPPPAVVEILRGVPVRVGGPPGEAVTPTGAAILAVLAEVLPTPSAPAMVPRSTGYGVGTARWPDRPNVLRLTAGEEAVARQLFVLEANLDDCAGQLLGRAIEASLAAGALDAWVAPLTMKKGRPGFLLGALAPADRRAAVARTILDETTTLGVRWYPVDRDELDREWVAVSTPYGEVRVKVARRDGAVVGAHPEYDDCLARARERGVPLKEVLASALAAFRGGG